METIDITGGVPVGQAARLAPVAGAEGRRKKRRREGRGRPVDPVAMDEVRALLGDEPRRRDMLIEHLHKIQDRYHAISAAHLNALAEEMRLAPAEVFETATFYHHFDVVKEGEAAPPAITVRVCDGLSCEMAGAQNLLTMLRNGGYGEGVRVITAPCVGRCDTAPIAVVNQNAIDHATVAAVDAALEAKALTAPVPAYTKLDAYVADGGYALLQACVAGRRTADDVIATMENAGLRGLGGAGFPAGRKWKIVRAEPAPRLMAVNIDEGEPGTFKDRYYLERDPHRFLEGMLIAAWAVGIAEIYVYLRDEYAAARRILTDEIAALQAKSPVPLPPIHLRRGAGAYICGEESAMIESIEGKKGMPRLRPPYVAQVGVFGRPTLEHNMETLYWVREIVETRRRLVRVARPQRPQGFAFVLRFRPRAQAGRAPRARRHHDARAARRVLPAACSRATRSTGTFRAARPAGSCPRRWPTSRSTSTRSISMGASSDPPRSSCSPTRTPPRAPR